MCVPWSKLSWLSCWRIQFHSVECLMLDWPNGSKFFPPACPPWFEYCQLSVCGFFTGLRQQPERWRWILCLSVKSLGLSLPSSPSLFDGLGYSKASLSHRGLVPNDVLSHTSDWSEILTDERKTGEVDLT